MKDRQDAADELKEDDDAYPEDIHQAEWDVLYWKVELAIVKIAKSIYEEKPRNKIEARWWDLAKLKQDPVVNCLYGGCNKMVYKRGEVMEMYRKFGHPTDDAYFYNRCGNPSKGHIEDVFIALRVFD
jgi:hypothetical protein